MKRSFLRCLRRGDAIRKQEETPENVPVDWNRLRSEAERKAVSGELRDAVKALFLSVLLEGQRQRVVGLQA